ncbi:MAG: hypothetical protein HYU43_07165, partial [Armatimonadetes bacterium]|nr:hypothetical protein [Armatimonadota bacterium]
AGMLIAREWERLGLKVQLITAPDWPNFAKRVDSPWENHAFVCGYISRPERLDPDELLYRPFHSSLIRKGGSNYAGYSNPEYDALVDQARAVLDVERRREMVWKLQEILARDLPHIPLFHKRNVFVYHKLRWKDVVPIPAVGLFNIFNIVSAPRWARRCNPCPGRPSGGRP